MTPPSTARNRNNTQAELSVVLDAAACTTSADASPSAEPVAAVGPVGPVDPPVTPVDSPVGPAGLAVSPSGPVVASGDGVSVGDGCSVGGGCSPSRSRMAMIARINAPCPGRRALGRFGGRLGRWLRGLLGGGFDRTGRPGRCGRSPPVSVGPVGAVGSPDSPPVGPSGAGSGAAARQPADAARQRLPDLVSRLLGARGREQTQHHEDDHDVAKTVSQDASFHPHVIDGVSAPARPRPPPQPPRHPPQLPRP